MSTITENLKNNYKIKLAKKYQTLSEEEIECIIDYLIFLAQWEIELNNSQNEKKDGNPDGACFE